MVDVPPHVSTEMLRVSASGCGGMVQVRVSLPVVGVSLLMDTPVQFSAPTFTAVVMLASFRVKPVPIRVTSMLPVVRAVLVPVVGPVVARADSMVGARNSLWSGTAE